MVCGLSTHAVTTSLLFWVSDMIEVYFWMIATALWWVCWRPGMVEAWRRRGIKRADLEELKHVNTVKDMFK